MIKMLPKFTFAVLFFTLIVLNKIEARPQLIPSGITTTEEPSTWEKIKDGLEKGYHIVYDETHCGFHKIKEVIKPHEHDEGNDPCKNKPYQQSTLKTTVVTLEETTKAISTN